MKNPLVAALLLCLLATAVSAQQGDEAARLFFAARANAQAGDVAASVDELEKVAQIADGFLPARDGFERVWSDTRFQSVRARMEAKLPRLDYAPTAFELEDRLFIPEGIAYDAPSHTFFIGSIAQKRIVRVGEREPSRIFAGPEARLDAVLGLAVDSPRRILYAVSTSTLTRAGEAQRRNAVFAFDIDTRQLLRRYDVPEARQLNDVAVAPGGRVFATDSASGAVFELPVKVPAAARTLVPPERLRGSNGLAASPDGKRLHVAHATGLAVVDLDTGELRPVANATRENIAAIDGLYQWQGQLVGIENVTNPGRVIVISLSPDGGTVTQVKTLLSHHHNALYEPTTGAVTPNGFYLLAATGVSHYDREGAIQHPDDVPLPTVLRIPLPR
ncbi:MAG TPA: hypothetical protein VFP44_02205 [Usitatibacter sp.]|nr:hypothetical protein [Usitatibacter sp.]